jgi:hypothetical protein
LTLTQLLALGCIFCFPNKSLFTVFLLFVMLLLHPRQHPNHSLVMKNEGTSGTAHLPAIFSQYMFLSVLFMLSFAYFILLFPTPG